VMPGMSGFQLAEELSKRVSARILFMSGYAETLHRDDHELDASLDFLQKPFSPQHFVRKLAEMLEPERTAA
jgi:FixJ family two-component response regulator